MRVIGVLVGLCLLAACSGPAEPAATPSAPPPPSAFNLSGSMSVPAYYVLDDGYPETAGQDCFSKDGYDDIKPGAQVVVSDEAGVKLGVGSLAAGESDDRGGGTGLFIYCKYQFLIPEVPEGKSLYSIHVGNQARGEITYSRDDLKTSVSLTIG